MLDVKDLSTGVHSTRLAEWALRVAEQLGVSEQQFHDIEVAATLHDIGKVGVPDAILNKPGRLTPEEREVINRHSEYGWAIMRLIPGFQRASLFVLHHHERMDGKGYPAGLAGGEKPPPAPHPFGGYFLAAIGFHPPHPPTPPGLEAKRGLPAPDANQ